MGRGAGGWPGSGRVVAEFGIRHLKAEEDAGGPAGAFAPRGSAARRGLPPTWVLRKEKGKGRQHVKVGIFPNRKQPASLSFKRNFPARQQDLRPGLREQRPGTCHRTSCQPSPLQTKRVGLLTQETSTRFHFHFQQITEAAATLSVCPRGAKEAVPLLDNAAGSPQHVLTISRTPDTHGALKN